MTARFQEDGFDEGSETLTVALDTSNTRVCLATESDDTWPPLYFTPERAREIGRALLDAARAADGSTDPESLFAEPLNLVPAGVEVATPTAMDLLREELSGDFDLQREVAKHQKEAAKKDRAGGAR